MFHYILPSLLTLAMACGPTSTKQTPGADAGMTSDPDVDNDGDGFTENQGDCNDAESLVSPDSVEITETAEGEPEGVDNNCDGQIDEIITCDTSTATPDATSHAKAIGLCGDYLKSAALVIPSGGDASQHNISADFGVNLKREGSVMSILSTGAANASASKQSGSSFGSVIDHPLRQTTSGSCIQPDPLSANDAISLIVTLEVPRNANGFAFDFSFFTAEYPEWVCSEYDDTFLALLDDGNERNNISFDAQAAPITVNAGFFNVCSDGPNCTGDAELQDTGFDANIGGGTGWLKTLAPAIPGSEITLEFIIFDEGDHILDSLVLLDHFRWVGDEVGGPVTVE